MTTVAILTKAFPYLPGEQFIEDEIKYWESAPFEKIVLLPGRSIGELRSIPKNITIDLTLAQKDSILKKFFYAIHASTSILFLRELQYLKKAKKINVYTLAQALLSTLSTLLIASKIKRYILKNGNVDVAYCYWNHYEAYAASINKKNGLIKKIVTRIHRFDLYEEQRKHDYMPLKRQFIHDFDMIFAISDQGKSYIEEIYETLPDKVYVSRLGVSLPSATSNPSPDRCLNIVTVSFCVSLKRIDKIIDALAIVSRRKPLLKIKWTHIGGGLLLNDLKKLACRVLAEKQNVVFEFKGTLSNKDVRNFFQNENVDLFINASESEGIPVSIMEAMSFGVPAIAPNVGGISDLVSDQIGVLMSDNPTELELATHIFEFLPDAKNSSMRSAARLLIENKFNANKNYSAFVKKIYTIAHQKG